MGWPTARAAPRVDRAHRATASESTQIHPLILDEGWHHGSDRASQLDVKWAVMDFLCPAESIGLLERVPGTTRLSHGHLVLTAAGLMELVTALRARALAPATSQS